MSNNVVKDQFNQSLDLAIEDADLDSIDARGYTKGLILLTAELVDANSNAGSPTLDVTVQTSNDGENWYDLATPTAFTQLTDTGQQYLPLPADELGMFVRLAVNLGGTGYVNDLEDPDDPADDVYWNINVNTVLW